MNNQECKFELSSNDNQTELLPIRNFADDSTSDKHNDSSNCCVFVAMDRNDTDKKLDAPFILKLEHLNDCHVRTMSANAGGIYFVTDGNELLLNQNSITDERNSKMCFRQISLYESYDIISIASGAEHTVAVACQGINDFMLFGIGNNSFGQLGIGRNNDYIQRFKPIKFEKLKERFVNVVCGSFYTMLLTNSAEVFGFGQNNHGQLGVDSNGADVCEPVYIESLKGIPICELAAGSYHTLALSATGLLLSSGSNKQGQLGISSTNDVNCFTIVDSLADVFIVHIAAYGCYSSAIDEFGSIYVWGGKWGSTPHILSFDSLLDTKECFMDVSVGMDGRLAALTSKNRLVISGFYADDEQVIEPCEISSPVSPFYRVVCGGDFFVLLSSKTKQLPLKQITYNTNKCLLSPTLLVQTKDRLRSTKRIFLLNSSLFPDIIYISSINQFIEIIFSSLSILNGSFLVDNFSESMSVISSGIDIQGVMKAYETFSEKRYLLNKVTTTFNSLLVKLQEKPPKIRKPLMMRFLLIALFHPSCLKERESFDYWRNLIQLIDILNAYSILAQWISVLNASDLKIILQSLKDFLTAQAIESQRLYLPIMAKIVKAIEIVWFASTRTKKLSFEMFYHDTINKMIDIQVDYQIWASAEDNWCYARNAPWLLNADTKTRFLRANSRQLMNQLQMDAMRTATRYWGVTPVVTPTDLFLIIEVDRNNVLLDTFKAIAQLKNPDLELKKPLKVLFKDEPGVDEGGVQREFFQLIVEELLDKERDFFIPKNDIYWFSTSSTDPAALQAYYLTGIILGLAIFNGNLLNVRFPTVMYKKLRGVTVTFDDLKSFDNQLYITLQNILNYDGDVENDMGLMFEYNGIPLKENGDKIPVTNENRREYVDAVTNYLLVDSVSNQFEKLRIGFLQSAGDIVLDLFRPEELGLLIAGREELNFIALQKSTRYEGYTAESPAVKTFWKIVHQRLTDEEKKKLLYFVTSSPRAPINGLGSIPFVIARDGNPEHIPTSHTCFFMLVLPDDPNEERMYHKIKIAIDNSEGFAFK